MRLDKYLKVSRIIKRRTVANEACDSGRVMLNDKVARASAEVKVGDVIEVAFGTKAVKVRVTSVQETIRKEDTKEPHGDKSVRFSLCPGKKASRRSLPVGINFYSHHIYKRECTPAHFCVGRGRLRQIYMREVLYGRKSGNGA